MNTDMTMCSGIGCARKKQCLRYINGTKVVDTNCFPVYWMEPRKECREFVNVDKTE